MKILIAGGSGLVGTELSKQLLAKGHKVNWLSRTVKSNSLNIPEYQWNPDKGEIDLRAFDGVDTLVNLAGASISKPWTPEYMSQILRSRVDSTRLLFNTVEQHTIKLQKVLAASAFGIYPNDDSEKQYAENDKAGNGFLAQVCTLWENESKQFETIGISTAICRVGLVLSAKGGILSQVALPVKYGLGSAIGTGKQWMPWIHIKDLARMMIFMLENEKSKGVYNGVAPEGARNKEFTKTLARVLNRPMFLPAVPSGVIKLVLGNRAELLLSGTNVSSQKIEAAGFNFHFPTLQEALDNLLK